MSANPSPELGSATVFESFTQCTHSFGALLMALGADDSRPIKLGQVSLESLLEQYGRLKIWGDQARADLPARARGSLGDTLRHDNELKSTVLDYEDIIWLCQRFSEANMRRREQIEYWSGHPYNSGMGHANIVDPVTKIFEAPPPLVQESDVTEVEDAGHGEAPVVHSQPTQAITISGASKQGFSTFAISELHETKTSARPRTVYTPTEVGKRRSTTVPPPPKVSEDNDVFTCPYCGTMLDADLMRDRRSWNTKLFLSRNDWIYHELQVHRRRYLCRQCNAEISDRSRMLEHTEQHHRELQIHLAGHMEEIALFALPMIHSEEGGEGSQTNGSRRVIESAVLGLSDMSKSEDTCDQGKESRTPIVPAGADGETTQDQAHHVEWFNKILAQRRDKDVENGTSQWIAGMSTHSIPNEDGDGAQLQKIGHEAAEDAAVEIVQKSMDRNELNKLRLRSIMRRKRATQSGYTRGSSFIPISSVAKHLSPEVVSAILPACLAENEVREPGVVRKICGNEAKRKNETKGDSVAYDRILAILIHMNKSTSLGLFMQGKISNGDLPLKLEIRATRRGQNVTNVFSSLTNRPLAPINPQNGWDLADQKRLCEVQWLFLAPVFRPRRPKERITHHEIEPCQPLPFREIKQSNEPGGAKSVMTGGFGMVKRVMIHSAHNRFNSHSFAVKHIKLTDAADDDFEQEADNLERLNLHRHKHIVELLFTLELLELGDRQPEYLLVFPLATGNLRSFWSDVEPDSGARLPFWALQQCLGLADALSVVHGVEQGPGLESTHQRPPRESSDLEPIFGIHSDIKPENILWFQGPPGQLGTLQLADFGVSTFHRAATRSVVPIGAGTQTYSPPESYLLDTKSQFFDIWSLGCVFLEFISYLVLGQDPTNNFSKLRLQMAGLSSTERVKSDTFYIIKNYEPFISDAVVHRMKQLLEHPRCTQFVQDFVKLVRDKMLVIDCEHRWRIRAVVAALKGMVNKGDQNPVYYTAPCPELKPEG
ncbi:hypothetical protein OQA88_8728 [Cercophora sp. LCS_1]